MVEREQLEEEGGTKGRTFGPTQSLSTLSREALLQNLGLPLPPRKPLATAVVLQDALASLH